MNSALCRDELTVTQDRNEGRRGSEVELWIRICGWVPLRWSNQITRIMVDQMNRWIHSGQGFIGSFDLLIRVISDHWSWSRWSQRNAPIYLRISVECFHSRGQRLRKLIGTKESVCIRKEFNSHRIGSGHHIWPRFYCFGTPIWPPWRHVKTSALLVALLTNAKTIELIPVPSGSFFQPWSCPEKIKAWTLRVWNKIIQHSIIQHISLLYLSSYLKSLISIRIKLFFLGCFPLMG